MATKRSLRPSLLAIVLLCAALALGGCSGGSGGERGSAANEPAAAGNTAADPAAANGPSEDATGEAGTAGGPFDPPVEITYVKHIENAAFKSGESAEDNVHLKWAKDKLGVVLKPLWTTTGDINQTYLTKINLMIASGQEMPDVAYMPGTIDQTVSIINSGKWADAGELFDKYANETWKSAVNRDPSIWNKYTFDGKRLAIPVPDVAMGSDTVIWVRDDWFKKLNLAYPTTIEEFEKVLDAFVNQDPDGNGKKDTYGLSISLKNDIAAWYSDSAFVFGAYGAVPDIWNKLEDNTLQYGLVDPSFKTGLKKLNEWYGKKYFSPESGNLAETEAADFFAKGNVGMVAGPRWGRWWPLNNVESAVPGAKLKAIPVPRGPEGKAYMRSTPADKGAFLISKDMKNPEAFFAYYNYLYENWPNPPKGGDFEYGFAEGYDWVMKDGKPSSNREDMPEKDLFPISWALAENGGMVIPDLEVKIQSRLFKEGKDFASTPLELRLAAANAPEAWEASAIVLDNQAVARKNWFTGPPTETMKSRGSELKSMMMETLVKYIYGKATDADVDGMVAKWRSSGGDDITREVNEWWASVQ